MTALSKRTTFPTGPRFNNIDYLSSQHGYIIICSVKYVMKLLILSPNSTVAPLNFGNNCFHPLLCNGCNLSSLLGLKLDHGPLARYVKCRVAHAPGMPGAFFPTPRVSHPDMHHGTCVPHVPRCMPGSLTIAVSFEIGGGENVPGIPGACATGNFTYLARGPW